MAPVRNLRRRTAERLRQPPYRHRSGSPACPSSKSRPVEYFGREVDINSAITMKFANGALANLSVMETPRLARGPYHRRRERRLHSARTDPAQQGAKGRIKSVRLPKQTQTPTTLRPVHSRQSHNRHTRMWPRNPPRHRSPVAVRPPIARQADQASNLQAPGTQTPAEKMWQSPPRRIAVPPSGPKATRLKVRRGGLGVPPVRPKAASCGLGRR